MRVGLDYRSALKPNSRRRGIGRYTRELTRSLLRNAGGPQFPVLYTIPGVSREPLEGAFLEREVFYLRKPSRLNWAIEAVLLSRHARRDGLGLFHAMDPVAVPARLDCPLVVSVHDLIPLIFAREMRGQIPLDYRIALGYARRRYRSAARILTLSEHSKNDICRLLRLPPGQVEVVPLGSSIVPAALCRSEASRAVEERLGIGPGYLLYVGGTDFRKNLVRLVEAFGLIRSRGYRGRLVLVGETFSTGIPEVVALRSQVSQLGLEGRVDFVGYLDDVNLSLLFQACDCFIFPSLYEGFGLPVLEAMRCGAPLVVSRASSIPEVAGDAAFYFDPEDSEDLAGTLFRALEDPVELEQRRAAGLSRAGEFSWERAAQKVARVYDELIQTGTRSPS